MLPKKHRLSKTADVNITTAKGRSFFSRSFILKSLNRSDLDAPQIGVIASVKVSKSAVVRNRLKRVIRQKIHEYIKDIKPGYYIFIVKHAAVSVTSDELRQELEFSLKKAKLI